MGSTAHSDVLVVCNLVVPSSPSLSNFQLTQLTPFRLNCSRYISNIGLAVSNKHLLAIYGFRYG